MTLTSCTPDVDLLRANRTTILLMLLIMGIAAAVRLPHLADRGYVLDEAWTAELATGRASMHLHLPKYILLNQTDVYDLTNAPSCWHIWTGMEITHPPLYFLLLRWWEDLFGDTDWSGRMFSLIASVAAVGIFFDAVRLLSGRSTAIWASLLMALAGPMIEYGRITRNYALLLAVALAAVDALTRIEKFGLTRRRLVSLCAALLATLLTHYFCIAAVAAIGIYALVRFAGKIRRKVLIALFITGAVYLLVWGPFMWRQRALFSTSDASTLFLKNDATDPIKQTLERAIMMPARLLAPPRRSMTATSAVMAVLYLLPFLLIRRRPELLLWALWLVGTVGLVLSMDLARGTEHLLYIRYTLLAGPAVYALIPTLFAAVSKSAWVRHAIPVAAVLSCALAVSQIYHPWDTDSRQLARDVGAKANARDLIVFVGAENQCWTGASQYLVLSRYLRPLPCPIALLTQPAEGEVLSRAHTSPLDYVFSDGQNLGPKFIPAATPGELRMYFGYGWLWIVSGTTRAN